MKLIKGSTEEIAGLACDSSSRYVATHARYDFYINVWDLESGETSVATPSFRVNTGVEVERVKFHRLDKTMQVLVALDKSQVQFYRLQTAQEEKLLKLAGSIKDENAMIASCEFMGKSQIMIEFSMGHGCAFKSMGYLSDQGKLIKSQVVNSKTEFTEKNNKQRPEENVIA